MKANFGSISSRTIRAEDLIPAFASELHRLRGSLPKDLYSSIRALKDYNSEDAQWILDDLFDELDSLAPEYGYFGAHPGDGADYGFWLCEEWQQMAMDDDVLFVDDLSKVPDGTKGEALGHDRVTGKLLRSASQPAYTGTVCLINDHGNATLYSCRRGKLKEIWSIV